MLFGWGYSRLRDSTLYFECVRDYIMFKDIARTWLENRTGINYDDTVLNELADDLALILIDVFEMGRMRGYDEGLEENLSELQW